MIGMVLGSVGTPFSPWQAAQTWVLLAISSAAKAGVTSSANTAPATAGRKPLDIPVSLARPFGPAESGGALWEACQASRAGARACKAEESRYANRPRIMAFRRGAPASLKLSRMNRGEIDGSDRAGCDETGFAAPPFRQIPQLV